MAELERLCGAGIGAIFMRLGTHQFSHRDVWDTIRLGLEGGGLSGVAASALVLRYQDEPLMDTAARGRIVAAAVNGVPKAADAAGNAAAEGEGTTAPATSRSSTAPGRSRDSRRRRSAG